MGPIELGLIVVVTVITFGGVYLLGRFAYRKWSVQPPALPDYSKYKTTLKAELDKYTPELKTVCDNKDELEGKLVKLEQAIAEGKLDARKRRETLIEIRGLQRKLRKLHASQVALERNIEGVEIDQENVELFERCQPRDRPPEMSKDMADISARIRQRLTDGEKVLDQVRVDGEDVVAEAISVGEEDQDLEDLEREIRQRAKDTASKDKSTTIQDLAKAARDAVTSPDADPKSRDKEPRDKEPPPRALDFN